MPSPGEDPVQNFFRRTPGLSRFYDVGFAAGRQHAQLSRTPYPSQPTGGDQDIPWASGEKQVQPEEAPYGKQTIAFARWGESAGRKWEGFTSPYTEYIAPLQGHGPVYSKLGTLASWTVNLPSELIRTGTMIPGGLAVLAARPEWIPGAITYAAIETGKEVIKDPVGTGYKFAVSYAVADLALKGGSRFSSGIKPRITELRAMAGSPVEQWGAIRGTTTLFKATRGIESRLRAEPDLSKVVGVGGKAPQLTKALSGQTHSIFGRATEVSQMPHETIAPRGYTYDVDVLAQDTALLTKQANAIFGAGKKVVDIHGFNEAPGYPIGKATGITPTYAKKAYFPYVPKSKTDLLIGKSLTQEKLYIQAGRKATSVIGEPRGGMEWKYGPDYWRLKDVVDMMRTSSYLKGEMEAKIASSSRLNIPVQVMGRLKVRAISKGLSQVGEYWSRPTATKGYLEADIYQPMIRRLSQGKPLSTTGPGRNIGEVKFAGYRIPKGEKLPSPSIMARSTAIKSPATSPSSRISRVRYPSQIISPIKSSKITSRSSPSIRIKPKSPSIRTVSISPPNRSPPIKSPSLSPPYRPKSTPPYSPTTRTPPFKPPGLSPPTLRTPRIKTGTWWPEEKKQPFKRTASAKDLGWKITNPVPTLKGFGKIRRFKFK